jgi:hypothetical protein
MNIGETIQPKSDQLNADDLIGGSKTIKITQIKVYDREVQPVEISYEGDEGKPYKPSLGMRRVLVQLWGEDEQVYIGRSLTLYRNDSVKFGGYEVGGIRISHASDIKEPTRVLETVAKGKRQPITINPLKIAKKKLTDLEGAKKAIEDKKVTLEKLKAKFDLTDEQINFLTDERV